MIKRTIGVLLLSWSSFAAGQNIRTATIPAMAVLLAISVCGSVLCIRANADREGKS